MIVPLLLVVLVAGACVAYTWFAVLGATLKSDGPNVSIDKYETTSKKTVETMLGLLGRLPLARRSVGLS